MQDINGKLTSQWNNDYWKLHNKVLNGKRNIQQAKSYMETNYIDACNSRKAFTYLMYVHPQDSILEANFYNLLCDAVKMGHGADTNFNNVFR